MLDVAGDGCRRVEDGVLEQCRVVGADPLGVASAEGIVGERAGSARGVVDHGDLEQRAVGQDVLGEGISGLRFIAPPPGSQLASRNTGYVATLAFVKQDS